MHQCRYTAIQLNTPCLLPARVCFADLLLWMTRRMSYPIDVHVSLGRRGRGSCVLYVLLHRHACRAATGEVGVRWEKVTPW